ncbi:TPA: type 1 fimbrial protein [Klebsiella oxytoca]|nr:type 1 fimbrial protein [Klebsiella oxytoca]HCQ8705913.1 type 1 fimbrial protein [Klebsiella oxytoca]
MKASFNRKLMAGLVAASMAAASWGALAASAAVPLTVTFTGDIKDNTCDTATVSGGGTVAFGNISASDFGSAVGSSAMSKDFSIAFSNCGTQASGAKVWFEGTTTNSVSAVDNVAGEDNATGVGVQVWAGTTQLKSDDTAATTTFALTPSAPAAQTLNLQARVVKTTAAAPSMGALNTSGTLYVSYQ